MDSILLVLKLSFYPITFENFISVWFTNVILLIDIIERVLRIKWNVKEAKSIEVIFLVFYLVIQKTVQTVEQRLNSSLLYQWRWVNPLHPNISMHILHTVCSTFPKVLTRRNCWTIGRVSLVSDYCFPRCKRKLDACYS